MNIKKIPKLMRRMLAIPFGMIAILGAMILTLGAVLAWIISGDEEYSDGFIEAFSKILEK